MRKSAVLSVCLFFVGLYWIAKYQSPPTDLPHRPAAMAQTAQPPAKSREEQIRALLSSADRIEVEISTVGYPDGGEVNTFITELKSIEVLPIVTNLKLGAKRETFSWGTGLSPVIQLTFHKQGKEKGLLSIGYGYYSFDYFTALGGSDLPGYHLDVETIRQLRHMLARNKKIVQALRDAGCSSKDIDPDRIPPIEKPQQ